jgi:hypothetical protein
MKIKMQQAKMRSIEFFLWNLLGMILQGDVMEIKYNKNLLNQL